MAEAAKKDYAAEFRARRHMDVKGGGRNAVPPNMNFVRSGGNATVAQVLGPKIGNFTTPETLEFLARQHELATGEVLQRDGESDAAFEERRAKFDEEHAGQYEKARIVVNPVTAKRELEKMERHYRTHPVAKRKTEIARAREDWKQMNDYRRILGMGPFDYEKDDVPEISPDLHEKFLKFEKIPEPDGRILRCAEEMDGDLMKLVAIHDPVDKVRIAAEKRYGELLMANRGAQ